VRRQLLQDAFIRLHSATVTKGILPCGLGVPASTLNPKISLALSLPVSVCAMIRTECRPKIKFESFTLGIQHNEPSTISGQTP